MKTFYSILVLMMFSITSMETYSQTYLISQGGTVTTCSGTFYDSGGAGGNYSNNEDFTMTFKPSTSGAKIRFVFSSFALESQSNCNKDYFRIYDGENISAPQLGPDYCGNTSPGTVTATNATGALTFVFHSNGSNSYAGWTANISCTIPANLGLWVGGTSNDWNIASNWYNNFVPIASTNITIPASASNWPTFTGNMTVGNTCSNITMDGLSELTVTGNFIISANFYFTSNASSIINIGGDFTRTGIFNPGTSTVNFFGNTSSTVTGSTSIWTIFGDGFESNTGWILTGEFERTAPQGLGGGGGNNNPDPVLAFAGENVLGVDLTGLGLRIGNYEFNLTDREYQAISPTINCSGYTNVSFNFQRWLGVQNPQMDKVYIDISTDNGASWSQVWTNNSAISETAWSYQSINIPAADNQSQVKIRFCLGYSNRNQVFCGWNIDDFQVSGNVGSQVTFYNLTVSKANAELISNAHITVINDALIKPDSYFTNTLGNVLNIGGDALFEAGASGMASYIDNGTTNVNGLTSVQQYLTSQRWHLVSSPVSDATVNTYYDIYLKSYNEPTNTWTYYVLPTNIPMNVAQGYSAWASDSYTGTTTVTFESDFGDLNNSDYTINPLSYTTGAPFAGFNLLGNPYPCALDWNSNWIMNNLSGWMMVYDNGVFRGYHTDGTSYNGGTSIIPSTQGFWIRALGAGANITIPKAQRVHNAQAFYKETVANEFPAVSLSSEINGMKDETRILFTPQTSSGFDGVYDLQKFDNVDEAPTLYTIAEGKNYAVNYLSENYLHLEIPVGFKTGEEGIYQIESTDLVNFPGMIHIYLEDVKKGSIIELYENSIYEFAYSPLDDPHRFNLVFKDGYFGTEELTMNEINIYSFKNEVCVRIPEGQNAKIIIYDLMGREIIQVTSSGESVNKIEVNNGTGYYLVRVQTGDQFITQKVFIK